MQKISFIFHSFFKLFLIFLFVFVWTRYFVRDLLLSIVISATITFVLDLLSRFFFKKQHEKASLKIKEKQEAEDMFCSLCIERSPLLFFEKLFSDKQNLKTHKSFLSFTEDNKKTVFAFVDNLLPLSTNNLAQVIKQVKKEKPDKIIISSGEFSKECYSFINIYDSTIVLLDKQQTYHDLYKAKNIFPKITILKKKKDTLSFRQLLEFSFNRSRCKSYLISSIALLFCSLFVRTTLYYSIVTSILILFAIISFFKISVII